MRIRCTSTSCKDSPIELMNTSITLHIYLFCVCENI